MMNEVLGKMTAMEAMYKFSEFNKTATGDVVVGNVMILGGRCLLGNTLAGNVVAAVGTGKVIRGICRQAIQMEK